MLPPQRDLNLLPPKFAVKEFLRERQTRQDPARSLPPDQAVTAIAERYYKKRKAGSMSVAAAARAMAAYLESLNAFSMWRDEIAANSALGRPEGHRFNAFSMENVSIRDIGTSHVVKTVPCLAVSLVTAEVTAKRVRFESRPAYSALSLHAIERIYERLHLTYDRFEESLQGLVFQFVCGTSVNAAFRLYSSDSHDPDHPCFTAIPVKEGLLISAMRWILVDPGSVAVSVTGTAPRTSFRVPNLDAAFAVKLPKNSKFAWGLNSMLLRYHVPITFIARSEYGQKHKMFDAAWLMLASRLDLRDRRALLEQTILPNARTSKTWFDQNWSQETIENAHLARAILREDLINRDDPMPLGVFDFPFKLQGTTAT
ncbi:hypothetical protein B2G71_22940 [Novosphingobium sp. PC22D]|uniref:Uncharacterized protein n=1 Tax=Novosphingobium album (ex Hu et al. 2023) TaxID=2930093 RepID=A0ABT0B4Y3_9SPHN|nr:MULTISPECIES: hypothetical protein [Novosphingobium]MCJ2180147.1 hypothetical protein [Novosphingobium album (ex Hu et al. 2023)]PEQ10318.1 hypothetical protein B2G71_22940 [Novosphingobium sp. PC22D]